MRINENKLNFQNSLYLIYLGFSRKSNEILLRQSDLLNSNNEVFEKTRQIRDLVDHMILAIIW
jgi:galactokinase/mevalonate kinase-like predicted kinase